MRGIAEGARNDSGRKERRKQKHGRKDRTSEARKKPRKRASKDSKEKGSQEEAQDIHVLDRSCSTPKLCIISRSQKEENSRAAQIPGRSRKP